MTWLIAVGAVAVFLLGAWVGVEVTIAGVGHAIDRGDLRPGPGLEWKR
jgi:hypothetical protein